MEERVRSDQIEVVRVKMGVGCDRRAGGECRPVKTKPGEVPAFDHGPQREPVNPVFEPVMIRGNNHESDEKNGGRPVAFSVLPEPIQTDRGDETDEEENQPPA